MVKGTATAYVDDGVAVALVNVVCGVGGGSERQGATIVGTIAASRRSGGDQIWVAWW